jgi:hypothetical protein
MAVSVSIHTNRSCEPRSGNTATSGTGSVPGPEKLVSSVTRPGPRGFWGQGNGSHSFVGVPGGGASCSGGGDRLILPRFLLCGLLRHCLREKLAIWTQLMAPNATKTRSQTVTRSLCLRLILDCRTAECGRKDVVHGGVSWTDDDDLHLWLVSWRLRWGGGGGGEGLTLLSLMPKLTSGNGRQKKSMCVLSFLGRGGRGPQGPPSYLRLGVGDGCAWRRHDPRKCSQTLC